MEGKYLEITIEIPSEYQEILISELLDHDFDGFEQNDNYLLAYIPHALFNDVTRTFLETWTILQSFPCSVISEKIYEPQNWNESWEKTIKPMTIGQFFLRPTWAAEPTPENKVLLEIDPKMAFGTGYHETTRLMLRFLPDVISKGDTVLDIGTGTGILAIAAIKLGAQHAFGFDIDEWSSVNATENAYLNNVSSQFVVKEGSFDIIPENTVYNVVLANVNRNMLLSTSAQITNRVKPGGQLLLSGLLDSDEDTILGNPHYATLTHKETIRENEWISIHFER